MGEIIAMDFPADEKERWLGWEQSLQNFMLSPPETNPVARSVKRPRRLQFLENPRPGPFQNGISVILGWV